jgi:hypothetical protein
VSEAPATGSVTESSGVRVGSDVDDGNECVTPSVDTPPSTTDVDGSD